MTERLSQRLRDAAVTSAALDIVAIGDAIVDVIATCDDSFLDAHKLPKGSMQLLTPDQADELYAAMGPAREISGGSAANSMAGVAALGLDAGFIGQVADDQLGEIFAHDMHVARRPVRDSAAEGRAADRTLPDPRHARRAADDEHLPRRKPRAHAAARSTSS